MTDPTPDPIPPQPLDSQPVAATGGAPLERERIEPAQAGKRRDPLSLIYLLGLLVLSGALAFLWLNPPVPDVVAEDTTRLDALELRVQTLTAQASQTADRVVQVEQRPALPAPGVVVPDPIVVVDLAPLEGRLAALEARSAPGASAPGADLRPLEERLAALEARPAVGATGATPAPAADLRPLEERLAALEARPVPQMPPPPDLRPLEERLAAVEARPLPEPFPPQGTFTDLMTVSTRLDAVAARQDALAARQTAERAELIARLEAFDARIAGIEQQTGQQAGQVKDVVQRSTRISGLQSVMAALNAGQPLGPLPGAPPALAKFAEQAPPTEAELRLSFAEAAEAAHAASQPAIEADQPFLNRMWTRAQQVVTVRQGDRVLLGDPIAGVLARAQERVDAGDLAGALTALEGLAGPAAAAMADWTGRARSLLEARSALVELAAQR